MKYASCDTVLSATVSVTGVPMLAIKSDSRHAKIRAARHVYVAACRQCTLASFQTISEGLGKGNHSGAARMYRLGADPETVEKVIAEVARLTG